MNDANPLKQYFRQSNLFLKLPTQGRWYLPDDVKCTESKEIAVYGLTAIDEIMLNTPDAMLNGQALERVITNCAPDIKNVKCLLIPDMEALFLAIKVATNEGKYSFDRDCPKCKHENNFEINCQHLLDTMTFIDDSDVVVNFNDDLQIYVKPYSFEMRQMFIMKEFEEERAIKTIDENNKNLNEFEKARILAESVERLSRITFDLVAKSIERIRMVKQNITVTDKKHINEWLVSINKTQADAVMATVNNLNNIGVQKKVPAQCTKCSYEWIEDLNFDPLSFFVRR